MKKLSPEKVTVEKGWIAGKKGGGEGDVQKDEPRMASNINKDNDYIGNDGRSWMYVTDAFGSLNSGYVGRVLNDGHIELLRNPIKRYESYEEVLYDRVVVGLNGS